MKHEGTELPLVSVVIPCFNQAHFLGEAIRTILAQSYANVEVVVVDDGSSDRTREVAATFESIKYVHQRNAGLPRARNRGWLESRGEYLVFLDADDRLLDCALAVGVRELEQQRDCAFTSGVHRYIDEHGVVTAQWTGVSVGERHFEALLKRNYIGMIATVMFRRVAIEAVGGFDPRWDACEDYDLYLRIASRYDVTDHTTLVAEYRRHGAAMSNSPRRMLNAALGVLGAQRAAIAGSPILEQALREGLEYWQRYYSSADESAGRSGGV